MPLSYGDIDDITIELMKIEEVVMICPDYANDDRLIIFLTRAVTPDIIKQVENVVVGRIIYRFTENTGIIKPLKRM